jgi:hypothetical protein
MGPTNGQIADALCAACSALSHPEHSAALEFACFLDGLSASQLRTGRFDASGLSNDALAFSISLFRGAFANPFQPK